jgi:hypothetical protein
MLLIAFGDSGVSARPGPGNWVLVVMGYLSIQHAASLTSPEMGNVSWMPRAQLRQIAQREHPLGRESSKYRCQLQSAVSPQIRCLALHLRPSNGLLYRLYRIACDE